MALKRTKPAPLATGTGSGWNSLAASDRINTANLPEVQSTFLAARFRLSVQHARVVAAMAFGEARQ